MSQPRRIALSAVIAGSVALSMVSPGVAQAQGSSTSSLSSGSSLSGLSSSRSSGTDDAGTPDGQPWKKITEGLNVTMIGDLLGDHQANMGLGVADLGIMVPLVNKDFAVVFGDSFTGRNFGGGEWLSPVGIVATVDNNGRIQFKRPLNNGRTVKQMINYRHDDNITLIPSDVINLNGTLYMQGMWNAGIGNVRETQIWKSTDNGASWTSVGRTSPLYLGGMGNLISWEAGRDGYIYVVSSDFRRDSPVYLSRFREEQIADRSQWELFNPATGTWGYDRTPTPILSKNVRAGEMSLRLIEGHWVLAMFNEETASIEVRVSDTIARDWNSITPARVVVAGDGGWGADQNENNFTQLYGGYIVPGSTLDNMDLVVSQWNTTNNSRYMSTQFNVTGLDIFFGITPGNSAMTGNHDVIDVDALPVSNDTMSRLTEEQAMEKAAEVSLVPLDAR